LSLIIAADEAVRKRHIIGYKRLDLRNNSTAPRDRFPASTAGRPS